MLTHTAPRPFVHAEIPMYAVDWSRPGGCTFLLQVSCGPRYLCAVVTDRTGAVPGLAQPGRAEGGGGGRGGREACSSSHGLPAIPYEHLTAGGGSCEDAGGAKQLPDQLGPGNATCVSEALLHPSFLGEGGGTHNKTPWGRAQIGHEVRQRTEAKMFARECSLSRSENSERCSLPLRHGGRLPLANGERENKNLSVSCYAVWTARY